MTTIRTISAAALAALVLSGCDILGADEEWVQRESQVQIGIEGPLIYAPDTVRAGVEFRMEVVTVGSNGCVRRGGTPVVVNQEGRKADLFPFDYVLRDAESCTEEFKRFEHDARITFNTPGTATLNVYSAAADGVQTFAPIIHTRTVQVVR